MRKLASGAAALLVLSLASTQLGFAAGSPTGSGGQNPPPKADADGDGIFDDPQARLAGPSGSYSKDDLVVAVIDTGIDPNHLDLDEGKVLAFKDYVNGRTVPYDD